MEEISTCGVVMGNPALAINEQRQSHRYRLVDKQLPGQLLLEDSNRIIFAVAVDASKTGIGLAIAEKLDPDTRLILDIFGEKIPLRVVWNKKRRNNSFRHGLQVTDPAIDLEEVLFTHGCIEVNLDAL